MQTKKSERANRHAPKLYLKQGLIHAAALTCHCRRCRSVACRVGFFRNKAFGGNDHACNGCRLVIYESITRKKDLCLDYRKNDETMSIVNTANLKIKQNSFWLATDGPFILCLY